MRIRRLRVEGFGNLKGDFIFSSDRCNLILEPNESGKSTLAAAILAALYGLPRQRASRERPIKTKGQYRPWGGGPFAVELELECRDRGYAVRRDFERETATVFDGRTGGEITEEFSRGKDRLDLGEALTGLTREEFTRCSFVGQRDLEGLREPASLTHALQRVASTQQGDVVAGEAIDALARAADQDYEGMRLGRGKVETEIKRLDKEIEELRGEMDRIAARRHEAEEKIRRLEEATSREGQVEAVLARVDYLCLLAASQEVSATLDRCAREMEELGGYREELAELEPYASFPADKLGEMRELKGKIESLQERRALLEQRLLSEVEEPLARQEAELEPLASFATLGPEEAAQVAGRQAVLNELWALRREKRLALRAEQRRLEGAGVDPGRVTDLASAFAGLPDDDRRFLAGYREKALEVKAALSETERLREKLLQEEGGESPALISLATARRKETLALVAGISGLALSCVLLLSFTSKVPALAAALSSLFALLYWATRLDRRPVPGAEEFGTDLQRVQTEIWAREKELAALQDRLASLASRTGRAKPERMLEEFRELEEMQGKAAPLAALAASCQEVQRRYAAAAGELLEIMLRAGRAPARRIVTPRVGRRFRDELDRCLLARARIAALRSELDAGVRELGALGAEVQKMRAEAERILAAGLGPGEHAGDLAAAVERFERAAARRERHDRLAREIIPAAERRSDAPPAERAARLGRDLEVLSRQIEKALERDPGLAVLKAEKSAREYAEERRVIQEEARSVQRERLALSDDLGDVLKEYRRDYPGRQALLASLEAARARAIAFRDAVSIASEVLSTISREAYAEWAEVLNDKTTEILRRLSPGYEDVRFDTDLSFSVRDVRTGKRLDQAAVEAHLSSGARDQIYLAVRMAVSEYLSASGMRLPFILDDPFSSFDDERFGRAMEFLLDGVARRHQIIVLSCHAARHRLWQQKAPEQLAERVRVLDLTPLSA